MKGVHVGGIESLAVVGLIHIWRGTSVVASISISIAASYEAVSFITSICNPYPVTTALSLSHLVPHRVGRHTVVCKQC